MNKIALGVDIGGSHISVLAVDMENGTVLPGSELSSTVRHDAHANEILNVWKKTLEKAIQQTGYERIVGIGFAMPGPFDYVNGIALFKGSNSKFESLYGINVAAWLRSSLKIPQEVPLRFINDATSFAVGESWAGNASGCRKSIAVTLGTGFGSAFICDGLPVLEGNTVPLLGCMWHLPYKDGIVDDYFSSRWFTGSYRSLTHDNLPGVKEIAQRAGEDASVVSLFEEFGKELGRVLAPWISRFQSECLVLGGNITRAWDLFGPGLIAALLAYSSKTDVHLSGLGENATMLGAARLLDDDFWEEISPLLTKM